MAYAHEDIGFVIQSRSLRWQLAVDRDAFVVVTPLFGLFMLDVSEPLMRRRKELTLSFKMRQPLIEGEFIFMRNVRVI